MLVGRQANGNGELVNRARSQQTNPVPSTLNTMQAILTIDPQGIITGLYTELIELNQLGRLEITRASTIEFNPTNQQWEARDAVGTLLFRDPSRSRCVGWEIEHFNQ
jgi:hypothetical protein